MATSLRTATFNELTNYKRFPLVSSRDNSKKWREAYGKAFPGDVTDLDIEMWCAARRMSIEEGGAGEIQHYINIFQLLFPYLREEWTHWLQMQLEMFCGPCGTHTILGGGNSGKDQSLKSLIRVPNGWKTMGEMAVGDIVCTPDGGRATVIGVYPQGLQDVYRVTFTDGTCTEAGADHLWLTTTEQDRKTEYRRLHRPGSVKTTLEIRSSLSSRSNKFVANHYIPLTKAVYGEYAELPIGPYLLGALLGDGGLSKSTPTLTLGNADLDILEYCKEENPEIPFSENSVGSKSGAKTYGVLGILPKIRAMGLEVQGKDKFIPKQYLYASVDQRMDLFRGLVDTDGSVDAGGSYIEYTTSSPQLAIDFADLARGLGFVVTESSRIPQYSYKGKKKSGNRSYRFIIRFPGGVTPCKNIRRASRLIDRSDLSKTLHKGIVSVEYIGKEETQCIAIDHPDHLYITDAYIVTHNSWFLGTFGRLWQACNPTMRGVMIINTTQKMQSQRAWKYVIDACHAFPWLPGRLNDSKLDPNVEVLEEVPDPKNNGRVLYRVKPGVGIISQTVKAGSSARATADIKGIHPPELLVDCEESNHLVRTSLERARANWITNKWYQIALTGNPEIGDESVTAREDSLYHFSEPLHGWGTIEWGKDFKWQNKFGGTTIHLDPYDSPRIREPKKYIISTWLPDAEYIKTKARELGGEHSHLFKQQIRGIYDHESLPFNPITLSMCHRFKVEEKAMFTGINRQRWAGFDPAYSGADEAFLKIAESGLTDDGRIEIDFLGEATNFTFLIDATSGDEPSFQMLKWVKQKLIEWDVPPENLIMDANVIGIGLGDIFSAYLSKKINKIVVRGQPSEEYLDLAQTYTAKDRCVNKATELWIAFQQLIITSQIKGLDPSVIHQLVQMPAEIVNGKIKVLEKVKFRQRYGYSPDRAECCLFIVDLLRQRGLKQGFSKTENAADLSLDGYQNVRSIDDIFVNMAGKSYTEGPFDSRLGLNKEGMIDVNKVLGDIWKKDLKGFF